MSRRKKSRQAPDPADARYDSQTVSKFINTMMLQGKKSMAERHLLRRDGPRRGAHSQPGVDVFKQALDNVKPELEVKSRRVGGATYQVPVEVRPERRTRWPCAGSSTYSRERGEKTMPERLAAEVIAAAKGEATR